MGGPAGRGVAALTRCGPQVNGVALHSAEHHQAVEALRGAGATVQMRLWRERMVEPENAVTITPLRPEDDYSPGERRGGRLPESPGPLRQRHVACLVRSEKGLGFSIAGGKGSTPYRAGDTVSGRGGHWDQGLRAWCSWHGCLPPSAGHLHLPDRGGRRCPPGGHPAGRRPCPLGESGRGLPGAPPPPPHRLLTAAPSQINGVDMTEARHDHAVSLLTAASPTIALLLEREAGAPLSPSPPPHSPVPPAAAPTTVVTATPAGPGPLRLAPSLLAAALEGPYPVEVRPRPLRPSQPARPTAEVGGGCSAQDAGLCPSAASSPRGPTPTPGAAALGLEGSPLSCSDRPAPPPLALGVPRRSACRGRGARWGSALSGAPTTPATRSAPRSLACSSPR